MKNATNKVVYSAEQDNVIRAMVDAGAKVNAIVEAVNEERERNGEDPVSKASVRNHMFEIGAVTAVMAKHLAEAKAPNKVTDRMRDYVYVHRKWPLMFLTAALNVEFGTNFSQPTVQRILIEEHANEEYVLNAKDFREMWTKMQQHMAPEGQVRRKSWLWRWHRFDEKRTAGSVVFRQENRKYV